MVLVNDDPFVTLPAETGGETKIELTTRRTIAMEQTDGKCHIVAGSYLNLFRLKDDLSELFREKKSHVLS